MSRIIYNMSIKFKIPLIDTDLVLL
jgi:hypothetical protein